MPRSRPLLAGALLATSFSVDAQPSPGLRRIGFVGVDSTLQERTLEALLEGLRALGYVDDKAIVIDITKHRRGFLGLLAAARLPAACEAKHYVIDGCLMSYGASYPALFRSSAHYVDRILKGAKPAELPVDRAHEFELVINRSTLQMLRLSLPESLRMQAERLP